MTIAKMTKLHIVVATGTPIADDTGVVGRRDRELDEALMP